MKKITFLALLIPFTLLFTGCESTSANTDAGSNTITALDGYIKDANITDGAGQVGVYTSSGQYTFANSITYPLTLTGGMLEDTNTTFDINMTAQEGALVISPITTFLENNSTLLESFVNINLGLSTLSDFSVDYIKTNNSDLAKLSQLLYAAQRDSNLYLSVKRKLADLNPLSLDDFFTLFEESVKEEIHDIYIDNYLLFLAKVKDMDVNPSSYEIELMSLKASLDVDFTPMFHNSILYEVVISPYTGKAWLDRNLGAIAVCNEVDNIYCRGDFYQWGRGADGHEKYDAVLTSTLSSDVVNAGGEFITSSTDWTTSDTNGTQRLSNWSKIDGSSICPVGYRVPTLIELEVETIKNGFSNNTDMFNSFLKFPSNGSRDGDSGSLNSSTTYGSVWSSSIYDSNASYVHFDSNGINVSHG